MSLCEPLTRVRSPFGRLKQAFGARLGEEATQIMRVVYDRGWLLRPDSQDHHAIHLIRQHSVRIPKYRLAKVSNISEAQLD